MKFDPVAHAEKYDANYYKKCRYWAANSPESIELPSPEIFEHMPTIRDVAHNATSILELGPFWGAGSTAAIRQGVEAGACKNWVVVDVVDNIHPWLRPHCPQWQLVLGDSSSVETFQKVKFVGCKFDFIFIDTVHTYKHLKRELELYSALATDRCTWLFHDTWMGGVYNPMADAIKEFAASSDGLWEYADVSKKNNGLGALTPV